ncbi:LysR family transcriptional regulator [Alcaligenaceae bacterium 429]|nr:LysR family transcriptional regulator [Alcaligenaceae bacterium 429]
MRLRHIEIFDAICRTGSLTDAAKLLHISQPAASKLLASAEQQLGFKLFERIKGRLQPTREAGILEPRVAHLQHELAHVRRLAFNLRHSQHGHLRIGINPTMGLGLLPEVMRQSQKAQPHITFDLRAHHSGELREALLSRDLDMIISFSSEETPGIQLTHIGQIELVHLGPEGALGAKHITDLSHKNYIALDSRDPSGRVLQSLLDEYNVETTITAQVQTHYVACSLVAVGLGETVIDIITAQAMLRPGLMISRLNPHTTIPITLMTHANDPLSAVQRTLIDTLQKVCKQYVFPSHTDNQLFPHPIP